MSTSQYVVLDYSLDSKSYVLDSGSKRDMELRIEQLKREQSCLEDPGRYDIMPLANYLCAFGHDYKIS